ncbi:MAG: hypothetical protein GXO48_01645 [Chlorobi bacterium]|nr:hypothetical protein [Chlorobiota bacterium]
MKMTYLKKWLLFSFVLVTIFSCSVDKEEKLEDRLEGKWAVAGFRFGEGIELLDSFQRMQLQFQLMQYQMLNIKYEFDDNEFKIYILNDSLVRQGKLEVRDSLLIFRSAQGEGVDSLKIVKLVGDTLEVTSPQKPANPQSLIVNLVLVRESGDDSES